MKKQAAPVNIPKPSNPLVASRRKTDMRFFYRMSPWNEWWQTFDLTYSVNGGHRYMKLIPFIKTVAQSKAQRRFLHWYLGPKPKNGEADPLQAEFPFVTEGPQDWLRKRETGGWYSKESMKLAFPEWNRRLHALEQLRETGKYTSRDIVRYEEMQQELDREFHGRFFLPDQSMAAGAQRAGLYIRLTRQLDALKQKAHERYRASLGINLEDISGLVTLMQSSMANADQRPDGVGAALNGIVKTILAKSQRLSISLPDGVDQVVVDAVAEEVTAKKKVQ